jgi:inositol-phosphate phosphatase/L-galactose 1-phosphate phosphatase/histidinol-phosphatase
MNGDYSKELKFAKQLAIDANQISDKYYKTELKFKTKADTSPVTIADEEINQLVIQRVKEIFPSHGVLGEENSWESSREILWVCDPIDGTIAFSMGDPVFMFSLALVVNGEPVLAVTRELANAHTFWAVKGKGAFRDDKQISVSKRKIGEAWLGFPTNLKWLYANQVIFQKLAEAAYQTNIIHGAVFKGMLIAQGLADGVVLPQGGHPWDYAALKLIVDEAGGRVTDRSGNEQKYNGELNGVVSSNGQIHQDLLNIVKANS